MRRPWRSRRLHAFVGVVGFALGAALVIGVAGASIPQDGVFTGCYMKSGGTLRLIDPSQKCKTTEQRITWNQQGQPGRQGQPGEQGPPGAGAISESENWCGGDGCPDALNFTSADIGVTKTLVTLHVPEGGYWGRALVVATINFVNTASEPVQVNCGTDAGAAGVFTIPADTGHGAGILTATFTGTGGFPPGDAHLVFNIFAPGEGQTVDLHVGWATLSLVPMAQT